MAYAEKYYSETYWGHRDTNTLYKASIQKDYTPEDATITFGTSYDELKNISSTNLAHAQTFRLSSSGYITRFVINTGSALSSPTSIVVSIKIGIWNGTKMSTELYSLDGQSYTIDAENIYNVSYGPLRADVDYVIIFQVTSATFGGGAIRNKFTNTNEYASGSAYSWNISTDTFTIFTNLDIFGSIDITYSNRLTPTDNPFIIRSLGQLDVKDNVIIVSEAQVQFIANNGSTFYIETEDNDLIEYEDNGYVEAESQADTTGTIYEYDTEFLEGNYKDYKLIIYEDPSGSNTKIWEGYLKPENSARDFVNYKFIYTLSFTDALSDVADFDYSLGIQYAYTGESTFLQIIKNCLSDIGINLPFRVQLGIRKTSDGADTCALKENGCYQDIFYELDEKYDFDSKLKVLSKILVAFNCTLRQSEGYYWIVCRSEPNSYYFEYDWATLTEQSRTISDLRITCNDYKFVEKGSLQKINPVERLTVLLHNSPKESTMLTNGGFNSDATGWSESGFTSAGYYLDAEYGGLYRVTQSAHATDYIYNSATFAIPSYGSAGKYLTVSWQVNIVSTDGDPLPTTKCEIYNGTETLTSDTFYTYGTGSFYDFQVTFDLTTYTTSGNTTLRIYIATQDAGTTELTAYIDNIKAWQPDTNTRRPTDWHYTYKWASNYLGRGAKFSELHIADYPEFSDIDHCQIVDSGAATSAWHRYGKTDNKSFQFLWAQQVMNNNQDYKNYVRGTMYDTGGTIVAHGLPKYNNRLYEIIGYDRDFRRGFWHLDLVEILINDVSIIETKFKQYTINDQTYRVRGVTDWEFFRQRKKTPGVFLNAARDILSIPQRISKIFIK